MSRRDPKIKMMHMRDNANTAILLADGKTISDIPWPKIISMRHRLIHGYDVVDYNLLWETITRSLPDLVKALERIIND